MTRANELNDSLSFAEVASALRRVNEEPDAYLELKFCGLTVRLFPSRLPIDDQKENADHLRMKHWAGFWLALAEEISHPPHRFAFCLTEKGDSMMGVARNNTDGYKDMLWMPCELVTIMHDETHETPKASFPFLDKEGKPMRPMELRRIRF